MQIRRALALTTMQRYLVMAINFATLAAISRLLTPHEIGSAAVGTAIAIFAISIREFASNQYFILRREMKTEDIRGAFTVMLILTLAISGSLAVLAPWLAASFGDPGLVHYLHLLAFTFVIELFSVVLIALLQRDMGFDRLAVMSVASAAMGSGLSVILAATGFGYMSIAWGWFAAAVTSSALGIVFRREVAIFKPMRGKWREMLVFGGYNGVVVVLQKAYESVPYLAIGRLLPLSAAGIYNRSLSLAQLPQKLVLGGVFNLMLPVMSQHVRAGTSVKEPYLRAITFIVAVQWPALIMLAVLAYPIVGLVLGPQWLQAVPVVQILVLAAVFAFCAELNAATLISLGGIRDIMLRCLATLPLCAAVLYTATNFGLTALALSFFITIPLQEGVMFHAVQRRVGFAWRELGAVLRQGVVVVACAVLGPLALVASMGPELSLGMALIAAVMSAIGWFTGLWLTRHPLLAELHDIAAVVAGHRLVGQVLGLRRTIAGRR